MGSKREDQKPGKQDPGRAMRLGRVSLRFGRVDLSLASSGGRYEVGQVWFYPKVGLAGAGWRG
jgi:hypothetical protein